MTKYSDISNEASAFIVSTCKLLPKPFPLVSDQIQNLMAVKDAASKKYLIMCGSAVEFYIRPLNPCIDDVDFLLARTDELVFSGDFPVLPSDISGLADTITCGRIEAYDRYPGFVQLRLLGKLNYNWKHKKYEFNQTAITNNYGVLNLDEVVQSYSFLSRSALLLPKLVCGPAVKQLRDTYTGNVTFETDSVQSVWCPEWPKEAQDWLIRPRYHGWPATDTISEVLQNGCHVVYVQHRSCRDDEYQWRLSFSCAEVILLHSWTKFQQIVYHLLRFFAKRELIEKDCPKEDEVLCTYHLKTLMLWICEEMSPEWWNSSSVIAICCELLKKLAEWLEKRHCPNYFIPEANLFHEPSSPTILNKTEKRLNEFRNSGILSDWFIKNYILSFIHTHFEGTQEETRHYMDYMLLLFEFWKVSEFKSLDLLLYSTFSYSETNICPVIKREFSSGLRLSSQYGHHSRFLDWNERSKLICLPKIQNVLCFTYYDNLLYILHSAYGLSCGEISWDGSLFVEFVNGISIQPKIVKSQYHNFPKAYTAHSSQFQFLRAQHLMENVTGSNSRSEFQLLSLMAKEFLIRTLEYEDSKCNGIAPAALSYLAALHFATSEYKQAIHLCLAVVDQTYQEDKEILNAGCLLFIDDVVRIVGLRVLQKKITDNNLHYIGKRQYFDLRLSPEVFAQYLTILSSERKSRYLFNHDIPDSVFPMDAYLKALLKPKCTVLMKSSTRVNAVRQIVYRRTDSLTYVIPEIAKKTVIDILMEYALENMTSFCNVIRKDFGIQCNTGDCYRALYLYKCHQYDEVLHLCERILNESDLQSDLKEFSMVNVSLLPPLDSYFDEDVQSLLGFHTLYYYLSPLNDDMRKVKLTAESTFEHRFARQVYYYRRKLHVCLDNHYSIKCHYFLGRHFLAKYLKLRCWIDCNHPYKEALTEFACQKIYLPFELIIRRFFLRKFRIRPTRK